MTGDEEKCRKIMREDILQRTICRVDDEMVVYVVNTKAHPELIEDARFYHARDEVSVFASKKHFPVNETIGLEEDFLLMLIKERGADGEDEMSFLIPLLSHDGQEVSGNRVQGSGKVEKRDGPSLYPERGIKRATGRERTRRTLGSSDDVLPAHRRDARTHWVLLSCHS